MSHRFLRADCLLFVAPAATAERLAGDELITFVKTAERTVDGRRRYYYAASGPRRVMIVMRNGTPLEHLNQPNAYVKALVGWEPGTSEFALPQHAGKRHTKISIDAVWTLTPDAARALAGERGLALGNLADVLADAPRAGTVGRGGARAGAGRPPKAPAERVRSIRLTLTEADISALHRIGGGNVSRGVRRLLADRRRRDGTE